MSSEPNYFSIEDHVEDTHEEYNILLSANHWGPSGKIDHGNVPKGLFTKADINTLVQKQVSAALHNNNKTANPSLKCKTSNSNFHFNYCKEKGHLKNDCPKLTAKKAKENCTANASTQSHPA